jgi:hypothetical protein
MSNPGPGTEPVGVAVGVGVGLNNAVGASFKTALNHKSNHLNSWLFVTFLLLIHFIFLLLLLF